SRCRLHHRRNHPRQRRHVHALTQRFGEPRGPPRRLPKLPFSKGMACPRSGAPRLHRGCVAATRYPRPGSDLTLVTVTASAELQPMSSIAERVKKNVVEHMGVKEDEVSNSASLVDDLGADTLDTVELVMALEEEFECEIPDEEAEKITSVQQPIDYIKAHVKACRTYDIPGACAGTERRHGAIASCLRVVQAGAAIAASGVSGAQPPRRGPRIAIESATESAMSKRRVVITGLGILSPVGNDLASSWDGIVNGRSGIGPITHFDASAFATRISGEVKGFDPTQWIAPKDIKKMDPFVHYGVAAAMMAIQDAGLDIAADPENIGVAIGAGIGGLKGIEETTIKYHEGGPRKV